MTGDRHIPVMADDVIEALAPEPPVRPLEELARKRKPRRRASSRRFGPSFGTSARITVWNCLAISR